MKLHCWMLSPSVRGRENEMIFHGSLPEHSIFYTFASEFCLFSHLRPLSECQCTQISENNNKKSRAEPLKRSTINIERVEDGQTAKIAFDFQNSQVSASSFNILNPIHDNWIESEGNCVRCDVWWQFECI
jgi:hypothetical protein